MSSTRSPHRSHAPDVSVRNRGVRLVRRATTWVGVGALGATGAFSVLAGTVSHTAARHAGTSAATGTSAAGSTSSGSTSSGSSTNSANSSTNGGLTTPVTTPQTATQAPVVVSGGS